MQATIYWHWWGWGYCNIQAVTPVPYYKIGSTPFASKLPIYRQTPQGLAPSGQIQVGALKRHYQILRPNHAPYELKASLSLTKRFCLLQKGNPLLFFEKQSQIIYLRQAHKENLVGTAVPDCLTGYSAVWHAEINKSLSDDFPLELMGLALLLRENHWSHNTSRG